MNNKIEIIGRKENSNAILVRVIIGGKSGIREVFADGSGDMDPSWMEDKARNSWTSKGDYKSALLAARRQLLGE